MTGSISTGTLFVIGLGPGAPGLLTPDAAQALAAADVVVGYRGYLDLIADRLGDKEVIARPLGQEVERAEEAVRMAESGRTVALVSSGDAGIYGMAGVALERAARGTSAEVVVVPGVTAALAAAARLGAPLAHDWASVSLSDLLTPWDVICRRIDAAAAGDFVLVLYNPKSRARTHQLAAVASRLLSLRRSDTPVGLVENAFRPGERVNVVTLRELADDTADVTMFTTVIVGSSQTFVADGRMVTPRIYAAKTLGPRATPARPALGEAIMAESLAIIDHELGPEPADPAERAIVRRVIHATADFDFAATMRFSPESIDAAVTALRGGAAVVTDVEMLRSGVRRDLANPLGVSAVCCLNDIDAIGSPDVESLTRSAAGLRRAAEVVGDGAVVAIGNAPTALDEAIRLIEGASWRPACLIGIPVGFVGVTEAKRRLIEQDRVPFITSPGRKGGTAVTAAVINALLELAAAQSTTERNATRDCAPARSPSGEGRSEG